jgi:hypothetical protein
MACILKEHLKQCWVCDTEKKFLTSKFLVTYFFPTPLLKLELRVLIGEKLLIATHLDPSNYLANQKQGAINQ